MRLLRVLETGEFLKVGSSKPQKINVRITAATNVNIPKAINENKFREDLFYRLNTVPIEVPPLRVRKDDIHLLFRKFSADFADKYRMPSVQLTEEARILLLKYRWPGNVRQLKNVTEQISVIEKNKLITAEVLLTYLPENSEASLPVIYSGDKDGMTERDILYKVLFDMKKDVADLKKVVFQVIKSDSRPNKDEINDQVFERLYGGQDSVSSLERRLELAQFNEDKPLKRNKSNFADDAVCFNKTDNSEEKDDYHEIVIEQQEESLSISDTEKKLIKKALEKHGGKRKYAAEDLGISERTLYRKIKEYDIEQ